MFKLFDEQRMFNRIKSLSKINETYVALLSFCNFYLLGSSLDLLIFGCLHHLLEISYVLIGGGVFYKAALVFVDKLFVLNLSF